MPLCADIGRVSRDFLCDGVYLFSMKHKLIHYRLKLGYNQTEFAAYLGINRELYCKYENGSRNMSLRQIVKIWQKLRERFPDLHIEDLLDT